jgi:cell wall assembly regulator SMI1
MSKLVASLISQVSELSLARHPDLPPWMYIEVSDARQIKAYAGWPVPEELASLYGTSRFMSEPWSLILFNPPHRIASACADNNEHLRIHSPPMQVRPGVGSPVVFGEKLIPFAYHDDSLYCLDLNPDVSTGGVPKQVVNVSLRKGIAKVVFPNLEAFLADGLKKMKRELAKEQKQAAASQADEEISFASAQALLASSFAYAKDLRSQILAGTAWPTAAAPPSAWSAAQRRQRADELIATNPKRSDVQLCCARLVDLYAMHGEFDDALRQTLPPMSPAKRTRAERALGFALPGDLRELLDAHQFIAANWDNVEGIGIDEAITKQCKRLNSVPVPAESWGLWPGTATPVFGRGLLPLNDGEPVICYDLLPGPGGRAGQLVEVDFECCTCKVVAPNLLALLASGLKKLSGETGSVQ